VADREEGVLETVLADPGVAVAHLEPEHGAELVHHRGQVAGHQADLSHPQAHERFPASLAAIFCLSCSGVSRTMSSFWWA
jgi:hypothetical protein